MERLNAVRSHPGHRPPEQPAVEIPRAASREVPLLSTSVKLTELIVPSEILNPLIVPVPLNRVVPLGTSCVKAASFAAEHAPRPEPGFDPPDGMQSIDPVMVIAFVAVLKLRIPPSVPRVPPSMI